MVIQYFLHTFLLFHFAGLFLLEVIFQKDTPKIPRPRSICGFSLSSIKLHSPNLGSRTLLLHCKEGLHGMLLTKSSFQYRDIWHFYSTCFFPRNVFKLLSSSVLLSVTAVMTEIVYTPNWLHTDNFPDGWSVPPGHGLSSFASKFQRVTSSVFWSGTLPADVSVSSLVSPPKRSSPHPHLKEKRMKLRLLVTQIPFPHLCRNRDHVCQGWGQACYSSELLQTELKETLDLSLKSMWSILVSRVLLFRIRLQEAPLTNTVWRETAIQVKLNLLKKDHAFHPSLQIVSLIIKIKITGSGLLVIISCSCYLLRLLGFLLWGLSLPLGIKHSIIISVVVDIFLTFAMYLLQISSLEVKPKKLRFFFSPSVKISAVHSPKAIPSVLNKK